MTSRRAVAPVIATLLLVAIAVVGGSIIFVFSQGFFSSAQISGAPQVESLEIVGYDATDAQVLELHDGNLSNEAAAPGAFDQLLGTDGLIAGDRIAVYLQNQSAQRVTLTEVRLGGTVYNYADGTIPAALPAYTDADYSAQGEYLIVTESDAVTPGPAVVKTDAVPVLEAGEEVTILLELDKAVSTGRDVQIKFETASGAIFVGTILAGQQSG